MRSLMFWVSVAYLVLHVAIFLIVFRNDAFAILDPGYMLAMFVFAPFAALGLGLGVTSLQRKLRWLPTLFFVVWIGLVTFAHFFVVAAASASV